MIESVASVVVSQFLLPIATAGIGAIRTKVAETTSDQVGSKVGEVAQKVWDKVREAFGEDAAQASVFEKFEKNPEKLAGYIEVSLAELLTKRPELAKELSELVETPTTTGQSVANIVANSGVSVVVTNSTLSGGSYVAGVINASDQHPRRGEADR